MSKNNIVPYLLLLVGVALAILGIVLFKRSKKQEAGSDSPKEEEKPAKNESSQGLTVVPSNVKNNNPGNIRINKFNSWKGRVPIDKNTDGNFEQFTEKFWGVRAMTRIVKGWIDKNKANTISGIITKYAPPVENNTSEYIQFVSKETGIDPNTPVTTDKKTMKAIIMAMGTMESGKGSITSAEFDTAWKNLA